MFGVLTAALKMLKKPMLIRLAGLRKQILDGERETLGLYLSSHQLAVIKELSVILLRLKDLVPNYRGQTSTVCGLIIQFDYCY